MASTDHSVIASDDTPRSSPRNKSAAFFGPNMSTVDDASNLNNNNSRQINATSVSPKNNFRRPVEEMAMEPRATQFGEAQIADDRVVSASARNSRHGE